MSWPGFRKVRRQVCKRIDRRLRELGLEGAASYPSLLEAHPDEWKILDSFCRVTISRFYRDRKFYEHLGEVVLPRVAKLAVETGDGEIRCWCVGSASGEEPYTVNILWKLHPSSDLPLRIIATEVDEHLIHRAHLARYPKSSIKDVPDQWLNIAFECDQDRYAVRPAFRQGVEFLEQDIRAEAPRGPFHLILCRNLVFTYFDDRLQREVLSTMLDVLAPGGVVAVGQRESLPQIAGLLQELRSDLGFYWKSIPSPFPLPTHLR
jgi:chemotaxis protein methyltransferase CheR